MIITICVHTEDNTFSVCDESEEYYAEYNSTNISIDEIIKNVKEDLEEE